MPAVVNITIDASPLLAVLESLELANLSSEVRQRLFDLLDTPGKLLRFQSRPAAGAFVAATLEPSDTLLDLVVAQRAR